VRTPQKLMLVKSVPGLGELGEVVKVKRGYARNYLLPRGLAAPVTADAEKRVAAERKRVVVAAQEADEAARVLAAKLTSTSVHVEAKASETGHLYGSVTAAMVAEALGREGLVVEESQVGLEAPIKELGIYEVPVKLRGEVQGTVKLYVVAPPPETPA
jgi:large subunit ribosomal protein L9